MRLPALVRSLASAAAPATRSVPSPLLLLTRRCISTPPVAVHSEGRPLYLDFQATTPTDPRVVDAMLPYFNEKFGNPHSRTHAYGWEAEEGVEVARAHIARLIHADPREIIFTSGATESNNTAVKGVARFYRKTKRHIITTQTEHKCVLDSARVLQDEGFDVTYLPVGSDGIVNLTVRLLLFSPFLMSFLLSFWQRGSSRSGCSLSLNPPLFFASFI